MGWREEMGKEEYSKDTKLLVNVFKREATRQGYDERWIDNIMREATSRGEWYLRSTLIFNLELLEKYDDRKEDN